MRIRGGGGGTAGAAWESSTLDFTLIDTGSLLGGTTALTDGINPSSLSVTSYNDAWADDIRCDAGIGLTITPKIDANFDSQAPGISGIDLRDLFADLDLATDAVAVTIDADVSPMSANYQGYALVAYESGTGLPTRRVDVGCLYDNAAQRFRQTVNSGNIIGTAYTAGAQRPFATLHLTGLDTRACLDTAMPPDPLAATLLERFSTFGSVPGGTANPYTAATLRWAIVGIRGSGAQPTITVRSITAWRLRLDAA